MLVFKEGGGLLNSTINKLPFELHLPTYQYCGPGTHLQKRLLRGDPGINELDQACKEHDIAYSQSNNLEDRHTADKTLQEKAWSRVKARDSGLGEKTSAWLVTNAMKLKRKMGMGIKRKRKQQHTFRSGILAPLQIKFKRNILYNKDYFRTLLNEARAAVRKAGGRKQINVPRVIPLPKTGGILPLIPLIFGGLSALGALSGGAAGIAKAVNDAKSAKNQLDEAARHNKMMEAISLGKKGDGLYLMKRPKGYGLFLKKFPKNY